MGARLLPNTVENLTDRERADLAIDQAASDLQVEDDQLIADAQAGLDEAEQVQPVQPEQPQAAPPKTIDERLQELIDSPSDALQSQKILLQEAKDDIERFEKRGQSLSFDPQGLALLSDSLFGGNIASKIKPGLNKDERDLEAAKLKNNLLSRINQISEEEKKRKQDLLLKIRGQDLKADLEKGKSEQRQLKEATRSEQRNKRIDEAHEKKTRELLVDLGGETARVTIGSSKEAEKIRDLTSAYQGLLSTVRELEDYRRNFTGDPSNPDENALSEYKRIRSRLGEAVVRYNRGVARLGGALTITEEALITALIPKKASAVLIPGFEGTIQGTREALGIRVRTELDSKGVGTEEQRSRYTGFRKGEGAGEFLPVDEKKSKRDLRSVEIESKRKRLEELKAKARGGQ